MARFIRLLSVQERGNPDCYLAMIEAHLDGEATSEVLTFASLPNDPHGIGPVVRAAITDWINSGQPVAPYVAPTQEELRAKMPELTRRQLLLALFSIGITEDQIDAALVNDTEGMIEWKNASDFVRTHPLITDLSGHFGLPPEQVDSLWLWARNL
ncbi:hypothetical protein [Sinorhizobium meliloti]|uniref:hypothetical protein n=1 Tax=Rhizobium meliloti TaxID=382 RepID=UPI0012A96626|nr:hypothetical protein [Sinorhizobium meliloti]QGJ74082.1 hypothetical protein C3L21_08690 [Sinorhizobium meliloti]